MTLTVGSISIGTDRPIQEKEKNMSLKTATLIALIGVLLQSLLWLTVTFNLITWFSSSTLNQVYSVLSLLSGNGTLALFLAVLYSKQKAE
jgi:hypothetical protein